MNKAKRTALEDLITERLFEFICAGGGDGDFIRATASDLTEEITQILSSKKDMAQ